MAIALDTPTISFSSLAFSFETPGEMSTPVGEGHEPRIVGIDVRAEREDEAEEGKRREEARRSRNGGTLWW